MKGRRGSGEQHLRLADGWCWFVLREEYCWLVAGGWFVRREKYCCLVADKPNEQAEDDWDADTEKPRSVSAWGNHFLLDR
jgi:hypothetical protein